VNFFQNFIPYLNTTWETQFLHTFVLFRAFLYFALFSFRSKKGSQNEITGFDLAYDEASFYFSQRSFSCPLLSPFTSVLCFSSFRIIENFFNLVPRVMLFKVQNNIYKKRKEKKKRKRKKCKIKEGSKKYEGM
jgi:hypothetical protein